MSIEEEAKALYKQWQTQQNMMMGQSQQQFGDPSLGTDQSPHLFNENRSNSTDQSPVNPINSVRPMGSPVFKAPPMDPNLGQDGMMSKQPPGNSPPPVQMQGVCSECGTIHPPLQKGEKCPNARVAPVHTNDPNAVDDATVNKHIVDIRNIIMAKLSQKGIKKQKKFFQYAIVELAKVLEGYNETE